jgi:GntR family transcriptional regulator
LARPTLYEQLAAELRRAIFSGRFPPDAHLPTEYELMQRHGVSRNTVRLALTVLVNEGLISRTPRIGTVVRKRRTLPIMPQTELHAAAGNGHTQVDAWVRAVTSEGRQPRQVIEVSIVRPPEDVATRLVLPEDDLAVARRRLRFVDEQPYNVYDSFFPLDLVQGSDITRPDNITRGANRVLEELGHPQERVIDEVSARMPTPDETVRLQLEPGTPVVIYIRTGYDPDDVPVRVAVSVLPADKHVIRYELESH